MLRGVAEDELEGTPETAWHSHSTDEERKVPKVNYFACRTHSGRAGAHTVQFPQLSFFKKERMEMIKDEGRC